MIELDYAQSCFTDRTVLEVSEKMQDRNYLILCKFRHQFAVWEWDGESSQGIHGEYFSNLRAALDYFDAIVREEATPFPNEYDEPEEDEEF